jgi:hypothetical protein
MSLKCGKPMTQNGPELLDIMMMVVYLEVP